MKKNQLMFLRLLKQFVSPYALQLFLGVISGLIVGFSIFGTLFVTYQALQDYDASVKVQTVTEKRVVEVPVETKEENKVKSMLEKGTDSINYLDKVGDVLGVQVRTDEGKMTTSGIVLIISFLLLAFLFKEIAVYSSGYCLRWVGANVVRDVRNATFKHLQDQSLAFFNRQDIGHLISRCTNDIGSIEHAVTNTVADICIAPATIIASIIFICLIIVKLNLGFIAFGSMLIVPICIIPVVMISRRLKRSTKKTFSLVANVVNQMQENFSCIHLVKAFFMEKHESENFEKTNNLYVKETLRATSIDLLMKPSFEFLAITICSIFLFLCFLYEIKLTDLALLGFAGQTAYKPLKQIAQINSNLQRASASSERIFEMLDTDTAIEEIDNPIEISDFKESIEFKNVSFSYGEEGKQVLKNISLKINKGDIVAFVGSTGSGKSTMANLLARFYDIQEGEILIDGVNIKHIKIASLRNLIGIVSQTTLMFNNTIRYNLLYGKVTATEEEMIEAAKQANAHDFVVAETEGYDRVVGDKGVRLSGGQKQRLAIARTMLKNPSVLILDEATSALDTVTEQQVQGAINNAMKNRTVFAIAHRLSTVQHATCIYVLEQGEIVEAGTHDELIKQKGVYWKLCEMQQMA